MIRNVIRAAMVLVAASGTAVAILAAPLPARAATSGAICESYGIYCLNAASLDLYSPVTESLNDYRNIDAVLLNGQDQTYLLEFSASVGSGTTKCVASTNDRSAVVVKACSGSLGVVWVLKTSNGQDMWVNQYATNGGVDIYLTGQGSNGSQFLLLGLGAQGMFQRFNFIQE
jgi:hypothetical protein